MAVFDALQFGIQALSLRRTGQSTPEQIERIQKKRLRRLLAHAQKNSTYLAEKYKGIDPLDFQLRDLPTSNKVEVMDHFEDWLTVDDVKQDEVKAFVSDLSNLGKLFKDKYVLAHTSGSEGQSLLLVQVPDDFQLLYALQAARGTHSGLSVSEIVKRFTEPVRLAAVTLKPAFYPSAAAFAYMPAGVKSYIDVRQICISEDDLNEQLHDFKPTHITAYASNLHELAGRAEKGDLNLSPHLEQVVNVSEKLLAGSRKKYAELLGAPVLDDYGMGECLFLTNGCPASGGMHVNADWVILEVVDKDNRPVEPGTRGSRVLVTNLANKIQPFIRYEVGDIVVMAKEPCDCGCTLPLIARIEGRSADIFRLDESHVLHPAEFDHVFHGLHGIREFQIEQLEPRAFVVRLELMSEHDVDSGDLAKKLSDHLTSQDFDGLSVKVEIVDKLRSADGVKKFKRVIALKNGNGKQADKTNETAVA